MSGDRIPVRTLVSRSLWSVSAAVSRSSSSALRKDIVVEKVLQAGSRLAVGEFDAEVLCDLLTEVVARQLIASVSI